MFKNYLKTAWRNIKKNKGFFALNFTGMYISVVSCVLIALIIIHETSFDKIAGGVSIYRVVKSSVSSGDETFSPVTPYPMATAVRAAMPDEKLVSQIHFQKESVVSFGNKKLKEKNIIFADSVFPMLFPITVRHGSVKRAFTEPGFAVLTRQTANRLFGNGEAVGRHMKISNLVDLEVAAVIADPPGNSHLPYNMLISYASLRPEFIGGLPLDEWGVNSKGFVYIGLSDQNKVKNTEAILSSIAAAHVNNENDGTTVTYKLQALPDIHYDQRYAANNPSYTINYQYLYIIGAIGLFLMLAACINYTNLSTGLAIKKSKEVGVRKTMGARRSHLVVQFLSETFLLTGLVFAAAALSVRLLLPSLNNFLDKNIPLDWLHVKSAVFLAALWILVSLLSGVYPAFVLSAFNPINALKNKAAAPKASVVALRRGLVIFQFLTAQILIMGAIVVAKQMDFIYSRPLGFNKEDIVDIGIPENKPDQLKLLNDKLSAVPGISGMSFSVGAPVSDGEVFTSFNRKEKYASEKINVAVKATDKNYANIYGLRLAAGRWFNDDDERGIGGSIPDSLKRYSFVLNETAVRALGFPSPQAALGQYVTFGLNDISAPVIGVVKDFNTASLHNTVSPVLMLEFPFFYYNAGLKLSSGYSAKTLSAIEKAWTSVYPEQLFESNFLNEHIASLYKNEKRIQQLFNLFTFLSIVINVLGLVGLLSFMIEQKTKEIGIRKVLGATVRDISLLLSRDFLRLIFIASLIAVPAAWFLMNKWLQDFAYRTAVSWWIFAVAVLTAVVVTCVAVSFQTIRAALANPVASLRTE